MKVIEGIALFYVKTQAHRCLDLLTGGEGLVLRRKYTGLWQANQVSCPLDDA